MSWHQSGHPSTQDPCLYFPPSHFPIKLEVILSSLVNYAKSESPPNHLPRGVNFGRNQGGASPWLVTKPIAEQ